MSKIMYKGNVILNISTLVNSTDIKRIELVTAYPATEEQGVLYIKIEPPVQNP